MMELFTSQMNGPKAGAVERACGLTSRQWRVKSRASMERDSGMGGRSPLPILNNAAVCCTERIFDQAQNYSKFNEMITI